MGELKKYSMADQRADLWNNDDWRANNPLISFLYTICRLELPEQMTVNLLHLNEYTKKYAEVWYNNNYGPQGEVSNTRNNKGVINEQE